MSDGVLSQSWHTRLRHMNHVDQLLCFRCGREIQVGDQIHTNAGHGGIRGHGKAPVFVRVYHSDCFDAMRF